VMGNRFKGGIAPSAMPFLHRYLGNPVLSALGRLFFKIKLGDFHCGLRGFNCDRIKELKLRTTGMEFASELIIASALADYKLDEVATTLTPDGRSRPPHLRTWRDGWRHLSFLLMYSPRWLYLYPGLVLIVLGIVGAAVLLPGEVSIEGVGFDIHSFIVACFAVLMGSQALSIGIIAKRFSVSYGLCPPSERYSGLIEALTFERVLIAAGIIFLVGLGGLLWSVLQWASVGFGPLEYSLLLRLLIVSVTAMAIGLQGMAIAFLSAITEVPTK
jgi:hypothetical protein